MMSWFGPSKKVVWRQLSDEVGADYVDGGLWKKAFILRHSGPWTVMLDTYTQSTGHTHVTYTRMRAPYVNPSGFRFSIYRKSAFSELGKWLGMQDIEVGDPAFDEAFIVKSNDEGTTRTLLGNPEIRRLLTLQPKIHLQVKDSEGWFGPRFPTDVDELHFQVMGVIKDQARLRSLFELFAALLEELCRIGVAYKEVPDVTL